MYVHLIQTVLHLFSPFSPQTGGNKRKGSSSKSNLPLSKKPKKKPEALDEDTVVAIALSTSLLEQEHEKQNKTEARREIITETIASNTSRSPALKWRPLTGLIQNHYLLAG